MTDKATRIAELRKELAELEAPTDEQARLTVLESEINLKIVEAATLAERIDGSFTVRMGSNTVNYDGYSWDGLVYGNDWYSSSADC